MDDLIILIIQAIARLLKVEPPQAPPKRMPGVPQRPPPPVVLRRVQGRRPVPPQLPGARRPAPPVARPVAEEQVTPGGAGSQTHVGPLAKSTKPVVSIRSLLTPSNLRRQFILTEIFQPPMALREER
jgi:hypothetical protein